LKDIWFLFLLYIYPKYDADILKMESLKEWLDGNNKDDRSLVILLIKGYFILTILCFIILILPFSQDADCSLVDHIFFAASIVSTTGLAPGNFSEIYNTFGQFISLIFIQLGGIGYMAMATFVVLKQFNKLPPISAKLLKMEFNLPKKYPLLLFIYGVFVFTLTIESIGAIILFVEFKKIGVPNPMWNGIFHSISAFCTAGFSLFGDSLTSFKDNSVITTTIIVLSLLGSIGFIVLMDFWLMLRRKRKRITLTSRIILLSTFFLCLVSTATVYLSDEKLLAMGWEGIRISFFQCISAHTTVGFNNFDIGSISVAGIFIMIIVMIIGASPAGTGGGIKTTSISALISVLNSVLKRKKHVTFFNKEIPAPNIYLAISSGIFYTCVLIIGTWLILLMDGENFPFHNLLFEVASALSTVGLSTGITADLSDMSKILISCLMFVGRLGVLTFGFALISEAPLLRTKPQIEDIAI